MHDDRNNYVVGYRKPPTTTQFKKGTSGNPKGRPKVAQSSDTILDRELRRSIVLVENGTRKRVSMEVAIAKRLVNKAVTGEKSEMKLLSGELIRRWKPVPQEQSSICDNCRTEFVRTSPEENLRRIHELLDKSGCKIVRKDDGTPHPRWSS